jgi:hypothetical protein
MTHSTGTLLANDRLRTNLDAAVTRAASAIEPDQPIGSAASARDPRAGSRGDCLAGAGRRRPEVGV